MISSPLSLIAELTHACPLRCIYCSNPVELAARAEELNTAEWISVLEQGARLGISQVSFTGGEPCLRKDLPELVRAAARNGLYVNLITSGVNLSEAKLTDLVDAGVDHVQLSFQDTDRAGAKDICGVDALTKKREVAALIARSPVAFTVNLVIHRMNHARLQEMIDMGVAAGARKIEIAHVQFNGWALKNRARLLPEKAQLLDSVQIIARNKERLRGKVRIDYVLPDYYADAPKACMGGWAAKMILINPHGLAAPCHSAEIIPGFERPSIKKKSLRQIWFDDELFNAFRGDEWMEEPCRTCDKRFTDYAGCRCQALALTGNARAADPVCRKSGDRKIIDEILHARQTAVAPPIFRA